MKIALFLLCVCLMLSACGGSADTAVKDAPSASAEPEQGVQGEAFSDNMQNDDTEVEDMFYITVGGCVFSAEFADNTSADAFRELLRDEPLTVKAHDYGGFEKVGSLGTTLPRNDTPITTVPGDVILYQGNQITLYYDTNSWSFTRLGKIKDVNKDELRTCLGSGDATLTFSLWPVEP